MQPEFLDDTVSPQPLLPEASVPAVERVPFWDYLDLLMLMGLGFVFLLVLCSPIVALNFAHIGFAKSFLFLGLASQAALYLSIYLALKVIFSIRYQGRPVFQALGWHRSTFPPAVAILCGLLLSALVAGFIYLLHAPEVPSPVDILVKSRLSLILVALLAAIAAPIFEELLFRGFLQPLLSRTFGVIVGILITSVLFGALHFSEYQSAWQYAVAISIVGVALGAARAWSGSLIPSTLMHAAFNGVSVIGLFLTKFSKLT